MPNEKGARLEFSDGRPPVFDIESLNNVLTGIGSRIWTRDLTSVPTEVRKLLRQPTLNHSEAEQVKTHFLYPRQGLVEIIKSAGREPNVPGGGELTTYVTNIGCWYPQLHVIDEGVDYSRFEKFHVNTADDGTAVDEIIQLLSGSEFVYHLRTPDGRTLMVHLACIGDETGMVLTFNGKTPHLGKVSLATPGTMVLNQAIGPAQWVIRDCDPPA